MTTIFRICKLDPQLVTEYMSLFLSFKEFLKILKCNVASLGYSYELLKPLLVYLECNFSVFSENQIWVGTKGTKLSASSGGGVWHQNEILCHLQPLNDILTQYHLYLDEIDSYQSTSTFFLPFVEDESGSHEHHH